MQPEMMEQIQQGTIIVNARGGQLSRSTQWTLMYEGQPVCRIERMNWKWNPLAYRAAIECGTRRIEVEGGPRDGHTVITFTGSDRLPIARATDAAMLEYVGSQYQLQGWTSPDTVADVSGNPILRLHWHMQTLQQIDVLVPLPAELIAIATTACLLHERPTD